MAEPTDYREGIESRAREMAMEANPAQVWEDLPPSVRPVYLDMARRELYPPNDTP